MNRIALAYCALVLTVQPASTANNTPVIQNMEAVKAPIEAATGLKLEPGFSSMPLCREDGGHCEGFLGGDAASGIQVVVHGDIVELYPTTQQAPSTYMKACIGAFQGLSGSAPQFAEEIIPQAFNSAAAQGEFKGKISGVDVEIKPDSTGLLGCRFVKWSP